MTLNVLQTPLSEFVHYVKKGKSFSRFDVLKTVPLVEFGVFVVVQPPLYKYVFAAL